MIRTAVCPWSWNARSFRSTTVWPRCRSGREGSIPSFTRSGRPRSIFRPSSCSEMTSAAPKTRRERSGGMAEADATSERKKRRYDGPTVNGRRGSLVAGLVVLAALLQACHIPTLRQEQARLRALPQTSFVYAADGVRITSFQEQNRILVPLRDVPQVMRDAVVAIEDRRFYQHKGVDLKALLRAAYVDATSGRVIQGGSTITEQYVKNRFLTDDRTLRRKIQ